MTKNRLYQQPLYFIKVIHKKRKYVLIVHFMYTIGNSSFFLQNRTENSLNSITNNFYG